MRQICMGTSSKKSEIWEAVGPHTRASEACRNAFVHGASRIQVHAEVAEAPMLPNLMTTRNRAQVFLDEYVSHEQRLILLIVCAIIHAFASEGRRRIRIFSQDLTQLFLTTLFVTSHMKLQDAPAANGSSRVRSKTQQPELPKVRFDLFHSTVTDTIAAAKRARRQGAGASILSSVAKSRSKWAGRVRQTVDSAIERTLVQPRRYLSSDDDLVIAVNLKNEDKGILTEPRMSIGAFCEAQQHFGMLAFECSRSSTPLIVINERFLVPTHPANDDGCVGSKGGGVRKPYAMSDFTPAFVSLPSYATLRCVHTGQRHICSLHRAFPSHWQLRPDSHLEGGIDSGENLLGDSWSFTAARPPTYAELARVVEAYGYHVESIRWPIEHRSF
ncbi:unnamed protein product [Vitrella brassicaformis CCMP3155]|uniref:Uncharacterized protein n=2 Tax=Vitrella brassicaformis TaxID=1169539 RepID=A0A0G4G765_VITBC|nr:unnamed protein product [Vitrella brassicaformis CCMP3155]|eukprot:CEM24467.1 unnamed protein product [Vitrella brassicaformis CCMP3155]